MRVNDVILFRGDRYGAFLRNTGGKLFCRYFTHYDRTMNNPSDGSTMTTIGEAEGIALPREFLYA